MPRNIPIQGDMTAIGEVRTPPFAKVPDPALLFGRRAKRFAQLASPGGIGPYLAFLGGIAEAQASLVERLPEPAAPDDDQVARAIEYGMPPLDRTGFRPDETFLSISEQLFGTLETVDKPAVAAQALVNVQGAGPDGIAAMVADLLADSSPVETMAEHAFVAAALQVHFARAASTLPERQLKAVGDGVCPACGGPPVASVIVNWAQASGSRFCSCALCGTYWHHVRVKCVICSATGGIRYQEIEGGPGTIKAETCDNCHFYVKVMNQQKDAALDPFADDVGSLGIDLLMCDTPFRRGGFNPFLLGY